MTIYDGFWRLAASPNGNYHAGYNRYHPDYLPGTLPGLRVFDGGGLLLESVADVKVRCVS